MMNIEINLSERDYLVILLGREIAMLKAHELLFGTQMGSDTHVTWIRKRLEDLRAKVEAAHG